MNTIGPRQRVRITFVRSVEAIYITHLDIMRMWERLLRRARLPVSHSAAQPPRPRLALAAPLAVGITSEGELIDVFLDERLPLLPLTRRLAAECPPGFGINDVREVSLAVPAVQTLVRLSEYRCTIAPQAPMSALQQRISETLASESLPRERRRDKEIRRYDLRPQIDSLWIAEWADNAGVLGMLLQTDEKATGRPDEVLAVLGLSDDVRSIHRVKLILASPPYAPPRKPARR